MKFGEFIKLYEGNPERLIEIQIDGYKGIQAVTLGCGPMLEGIRDMTVTSFCIDEGTLLVYVRGDER